MKIRSAAVIAASLLVVSSASAHDLFLSMRSFFLRPHTTARVEVLNGTFSKSEGAVQRARLRDLSVVSHGQRRDLDRALWEPLDSTVSVVRFAVTDPGTYVLGASLLHREITLQARDFNEYLETEGILPIIARRRAHGETDKPARERYHKHVKAFIQVGGARTDDYAVKFGYPAELVPLENPYSVRRGGRLRVQAIVEGDPVANQVLIAGGRTRSGARIPQQRIVANGAGIGSVRLTHTGRWYVKFIYMEHVGSDSLDYESKWGTMTFEVR